MGLLKIQAEQKFSPKKIAHRQHHGNHQPHFLTDAAVHLCKLRLLLPQTPADKRHGRHLHTVPKGKGKAHHIHSHLMSRKGVRAHLCGHNRHSHKPHPQKNLLQKNIGANLENTLKRRHPKPNLSCNHIGNTDKTVLLQNRGNAHAAGHHGPKHRGQGCPVNPQSRKPKLSADKQIISNHIQHIGRHIGLHGNLRPPRSPLGRIDDQRHNIKHHASHNDSKISRCAGTGILIGPAQADNRVRQRHAEKADHNPGQNHKHQSRRQRPVGPVPVILSLSPGHNGRHRHIGGHKHGQTDKLRLGRQAHRRHRVSPHGTYHQRINHARQSHKKRLQNRRPRHLKGLSYN